MLPHLAARRLRPRDSDIISLAAAVAADAIAIGPAATAVLTASANLSDADDAYQSALTDLQTAIDGGNDKAILAAAETVLSTSAAQQDAETAYDGALAALMTANTQLANDQAALSAAINALLGGS